MKTLAILMMLVATPAAAQLHLSVNDCGSSSRSVTNACASDVGMALSVVGSITLPETTVTSWSGATATIDVETAAAILPDWWALGGPCRGGSNIVAGINGWPQGTCGSLWGRSAVSGMGLGAQRGAPNQRSVRITLRVALEAARSLRGDDVTELGVFRLAITNASATGRCYGCATPACITFRSLILSTTDDLPSRWPVYSGTDNVVTYNGGASACAGSTPVRNRTWGALKWLYR